MIARFLKLVPLHLLLLPIFFVWHISNEFYGLIPVHFSIRFTFYYVAFSLAIFGFSMLTMRNSIKAGCFATICLALFFFWGSTQDFLRSAKALAFLSRYVFLGPIALSAVIIFFILLRRKMQPPRRLNLLFNAITITFIFIEAVTAIYNSATNRKAAYPLVDQQIQFTDTAALKPDIFVFIFDEYTSTEGMKRYLQYDNSRIDSALREQHFFVSSNSQSNYNWTPHALACLFNAAYLDGPAENSIPSSRDLLRAQLALRQSSIPIMLRQNGYQLVNLGIFDLENAPSPLHSVFDNYIVWALSRETLWGRIERDIWWHFKGVAHRKVFEQMASTHYDPAVTQSTLTNALAELDQTSQTPRFVYTHVLLPHPPFLFTADGRIRNEQPTDDSQPNRDSLYIQQVRYANQWIRQLAQKINQPSTRPRVAVIMGDHGFRDKSWSQSTREKQFMNFCSIYYSDHNYSGLYNGISPVNIFPAVFNKYFGSRLSFKIDSTIALANE